MEIIASHIIKPSSPTPVELKNHKLSSFDQISPSFYIPLIFFYENDKSKHHLEISRCLTQSLSEVLSIFYQLAGSIRQNSFVDCDDTGVEFVESQVHSCLAQLIQNPKIETLKQLVPVDSKSHNDNAIMLVKTSYFDCGGIAVGVCLSHKLGDMASFSMFMNAWASTCRGESSRITRPSFDLSLHFPPRDSLVSGNYIGITKEKIVTKRLVFESKKIDKLRQQAAASVKDPTTVEVVTAFIWRSFIEALKEMTSSSSPSVASHAVNLRPRTVPPMPDHTFGNYYTLAMAVVSSAEADDHLSKLRAAIREVDDDYIKRVLKNDHFFQTLDNQADDLFNSRWNWIFSSWRFPLYDVDFGWGKPVWVATTPVPVMNGIVLMNTPSGDGIEAWINIPHQRFFDLLQTNYDSLI